jgi:hypothetical protein
MRDAGKDIWPQIVTHVSALLYGRGEPGLSAHTENRRKDLRDGKRTALIPTQESPGVAIWGRGGSLS